MRVLAPLLLSLSLPAAAQSPLGEPVAPVENRTTQWKAALGKMLFWDEQLSSDGTIACGTCHIPGAGGSDPRAIGAPLNPGPDGFFGTGDDIGGSPGVRRTNAFGHFLLDPVSGLEPQITGRTTPSMIGAAFVPELFWDGRASDTFVDPQTGQVLIQTGGALESQSLGPLVSDVEMAFQGRGWDDLIDRVEAIRPLALASNLPPDVQNALLLHDNYPDLFQVAFGSPGIDAGRIAFAPDGVSDLKETDATYMGQMTLVIVDEDTIEQHWKSLGEGEPHEMVITLNRRAD